MNLKLKRVIALGLAVPMVVSFAGCKGETGKVETSKAETVKGETTAAGTTAIDTSKHVTISHLSLGNKPNNGQYEAAKAEWDKYLNEKLNVDLEIQYLGWTDYMTKYNLLLATGEGLDLINTASDWLEMWPNAQKGAFLEINDLLPTYAPITWNSVPQSSWDEVTFKGDIVAIPEDMYTQWINHGFMYRGDWAKEFGITEPIKTWEDYGKYLQAVKDNKSSLGVIPFDVAGTANINALYDGWTVSKSKLICIDAVPNGLAYGKSDAEWDQVTSRFDVQADGTDMLLNFANEMKKWGDAGYWREDVLNNTADGWVQFKAGLNGTRQHHTQTYVTAYTELEKEIPGADLKYFPWSEESKNAPKMSITHGATAIAAASKNPERALMVYDLIRNDETMYKLFNWGLEGKQYVINDKGQKDRPAGFVTDTDNFASNFWGGRMDKFELGFPNAELISNWKEIYADFDSYATDYKYGRFVFDKSPVESELAALSEVITRLLPAIASGKAGDPTKAVEDFRKQLELAGYAKVKTEVQTQMTAFKATIN